MEHDAVIIRGGHGLDFPKSNLDPIQIQINGLDLKSISTLTRSNIYVDFFKIHLKWIESRINPLY